jgi:superfamily II DNA or RNA helicase
MLRPYQARAIRGVNHAVTHGSKAVVLVSPTGSGKTHIAAHIAHRAPGKGLWLAHRIELVEQAQRVLPHGFQVRTIQGLLASGERPEADFVIVDEVHHLIADRWKTLADHYRSSILIGLTATPERADGSPLGDVFSSLVVAAQYSELLAEGNIVPCELYAPDRRGGLAMPIAEALSKYAAGPAIVFCKTVAEARAAADCVDGETPGALRAETLARFKAGEISVISNVYVLTEGFDNPPTSCVVLARGSGHASTYLQMAGRGLRPAPGKTKMVLVDLCGSSLEHGNPTLDREYSLEGTAIKATKALPMWRCKNCAFCMENPPANKRCPLCGGIMPEPEAIQLERRRLARKAQDARASDEYKSAELARLRALAKARGYHAGWVWHRYNARFGKDAA